MMHKTKDPAMAVGGSRQIPTIYLKVYSLFQHQRNPQRSILSTRPATFLTETRGVKLIPRRNSAKQNGGTIVRALVPPDHLITTSLNRSDTMAETKRIACPNLRDETAIPKYDMAANLYAPRETDPLLRVLHDAAYGIAALSEDMASGRLDGMNPEARGWLIELSTTLYAGGWMDPYRQKDGSLSV